MGETQWIMCPVCGSKTRLRIRYDTVLERFPLYCPKCKQETLISVRQQKYFQLLKSQTPRRRADNTEGKPRRLSLCFYILYDLPGGRKGKKTAAGQMAFCAQSTFFTAVQFERRFSLP